jgi:tubulin--tyrosine ligase
MPNLLRVHRTSKFCVLGFRNEKHDTSLISRDTQLPENEAANIISPSKRLSVFLDIDEPYTRNMIQRAFSDRKEYFRTELGPGEGMEAVSLPGTCDFQWAEYERVDWTAVLAGKHGASSYCIRKGISRKAQLALYTHRHVCKFPDSVLKDAMPLTLILETWSVWEYDMAPNMDGLAGIVIGASDKSTNRRELLDQCLSEARRAMIKAEEEDIEDSEPIWILKPSTNNKGAGIQIVHLYEQLVDICWSEPDIREWVLQRYISAPLLLRRRKFHIRAYVVAVSALRVYLSHDCLALCSGTKYRKNDTGNLFAHITNTAYQDLDPNFSEEDCIYLWNEETIAPILVGDKTCTNINQAREMVLHVIKQMEAITGELFRAYQTEFGVFSPIDGCFEQYGLDFIVDSQWRVSLLEVNPGPDFKQTGDRLGRVIQNLMRDTIDAALLPPLPESKESMLPRATPKSYGKLKLVYEHQVRGSARKSNAKISMTLT